MARPAQKFDPPPPSSTEERLVAIEAVIPHLATKEDIARLEGKVDATTARLEGKIDATTARLEGRMDAMEQSLEKQMLALENHLIKWFVGTAVAIVSVCLAAQIGIAFLIIRAVSGG